MARHFVKEKELILFHEKTHSDMFKETGEERERDRKREGERTSEKDKVMDGDDWNLIQVTGTRKGENKAQLLGKRIAKLMCMWRVCIWK